MWSLPTFATQISVCNKTHKITVSINQLVCGLFIITQSAESVLQGMKVISFCYVLFISRSHITLDIVSMHLAGDLTDVNLSAEILL